RFTPEGGEFWDADGPSEEDAALWRIWVKDVFTPLNDRMLEIILLHGDLFDEDELPREYYLLCAHIAAYKAVLTQWAQRHYSEHTSLIPYPSTIDDIIEATYRELKHEQSILLGRLKK